MTGRRRRQSKLHCLPPCVFFEGFHCKINSIYSCFENAKTCKKKRFNEDILAGPVGQWHPPVYVILCLLCVFWQIHLQNPWHMHMFERMHNEKKIAFNERIFKAKGQQSQLLVKICVLCAFSMHSCRSNPCKSLINGYCGAQQKPQKIMIFFRGSGGNITSCGGNITSFPRHTLAGGTRMDAR